MNLDFKTQKTISNSGKTPKLKGKDIVVISIQPWYYELGSNCKNIAKCLAESNRVLYVNMPITRWAFHSRNKTKGLEYHCHIIKSRNQSVEQIDTNFWQLYPTALIESINWLPHTSLFKPINRINNRRFANDIKKALNELNFQDFILFNDNDIYNGFYLKELLNPELYIYYMRDFLQGYDFCKRHTKVLEPILIQRADVVVTNSTYYSEYCRQYNTNSSYIGQGCNLELFTKEYVKLVPDDIKNIKRPVIGYVGALDSTRLDHSILRIIAASNPDWQIVLVGPEDESFLKSDLHTFPNVYFAGRRHITELPSYINQFDVCLNPQLINIVTMGNYPLKIDEYLAMGKPTVATKTKAMEIFNQYTYLAERPEDYPALISQALDENNPQMEITRKEYAQTHTWENSIAELYKAIYKFNKNLF
jgi:glycosyltransferase involved in cell wall biosynthesis